MSIFVNCLIALMTLGLSGLLGCAVSTDFSGGPSAVVMEALLMSLIAGFMGYMLGDMLASFRQRLISFGFAALCVACTWIQPGYTLLHGSKIAQSHRSMAPNIQSWVTKNFYELDVTKDGLINKEELECYLSSKTISDTNRFAANYTLEQISEVGHVTESHKRTTFIWISHGKYGGHLQPIVTTVNTYGVDHNDLDTYPQRVQEKYAKW